MQYKLNMKFYIALQSVLNVDLLQIFGGKTLAMIECMEHTTEPVLFPGC